MRRCPRKGNVFFAVEIAEIRRKKEKNTETVTVSCITCRNELRFVEKILVAFYWIKLGRKLCPFSFDILLFTHDIKGYSPNIGQLLSFASYCCHVLHSCMINLRNSRAANVAHMNIFLFDTCCLPVLKAAQDFFDRQLPHNWTVVDRNQS